MLRVLGKQVDQFTMKRDRISRRIDRESLELAEVEVSFLSICLPDFLYLISFVTNVYRRVV